MSIGVTATSYNNFLQSYLEYACQNSVLNGSVNDKQVSFNTSLRHGSHSPEVFEKVEWTEISAYRLSPVPVPISIGPSARNRVCHIPHFAQGHQTTLTCHVM